MTFCFTRQLQIKPNHDVARAAASREYLNTSVSRCTLFPTVSPRLSTCSPLQPFPCTLTHGLRFGGNPVLRDHPGIIHPSRTCRDTTRVDHGDVTTTTPATKTTSLPSAHHRPEMTRTGNPPDAPGVLQQTQRRRLSRPRPSAGTETRATTMACSLDADQQRTATTTTHPLPAAPDAPVRAATTTTHPRPPGTALAAAQTKT